MKSKRLRLHQRLVADAEPHAAQSSRSCAAAPLPPRTDAGHAASEPEHGNWEHLAVAVEQMLVVVRRIREARREEAIAISRLSFGRAHARKVEIDGLVKKLLLIIEEQRQQPRGGNGAAEQPESSPQK